jgi:hypothetical protein
MSPRNTNDSNDRRDRATHMRASALTPPSLFSKTTKRQTIVALIHESNTGVTRKEFAAAIDSGINCVSVMINQINKELVGKGWKISSINFERRPKLRGAPVRRYRLVPWL